MQPQRFDNSYKQAVFYPAAPNDISAIRWRNNRRLGAACAAEDGAAPDLYVFLIVVFLIERFPGSDLMHDVFRKTVMVATIGVVIWKLFGGMLSETSSVGGARVGGPLRQKKTEGHSESSDVYMNHFGQWARLGVGGVRDAGLAGCHGGRHLHCCDLAGATGTPGQH
eukprot:s9967_g2.t1